MPVGSNRNFNTYMFQYSYFYILYVYLYMYIGIMYWGMSVSDGSAMKHFEVSKQACGSPIVIIFSIGRRIINNTRIRKCYENEENVHHYTVLLSINPIHSIQNLNVVFVVLDSYTVVSDPGR